MFTILMLSAALSGPTPQAIPAKIEKPFYCRMLVPGVSRSSDVTICRTKEAWREIDSCRGATRYCSPQQKAEMLAKHTAFSLSEDSRIICRILSATGSRLRAKQTCMPQREWLRLWNDASAETRDMQDKSTRPNEIDP